MLTLSFIPDRIHKQLFCYVYSFIYGANIAVATYGIQTCIQMEIVIQVVSWGIQVVVGHGYFEGS